MIGLLYKDLCVIKKQFKLLAIMLFFYAVWGFYERNTTMFAYMSILFGIFLPLTANSFDEQSQWNKYALCMPIKKSYIAISKYVLGFLGITIGVICYYILTLLIDSHISLEQFKIGLALLSIGMTLISLYLPASFKLGTERARYVIIAVGVLVCAVIIGFSKLGIIDELSKDTLTLFLNMAPVIAFAIVVISCMISTKIIENKEY